MIKTATDALLKAQNADGGWGAAEGKGSNVEATAFALLGLGTLGDAALTARLSHGLDWLTTRQNADGSWPLTDRLPTGSWATALAVLALALFEPHRHSALRGAAWLLRQKGNRPGWLTTLRYHVAPHTLGVQLNPDLQGWSWTAGAFSWVEPTAYALLALKKLRPFLRGTAEDRIRQGELLLYDRMCAGGGWNHGNATALGVPLPPYPDTTAVALLALQDHQAKAANQQSLRALHDLLAHVESGLALSWSILCFALYGHAAAAWRRLLASRYETTGFLGETKTLALALLALGDGAKSLEV